MRIALFGGAFDPIHTAHLTVARRAVRQWALDRLLFIPSAHPPHKWVRAPYEDRYRMVELAVQGEPAFMASRLEARAEQTYSIDTLERVKPEVKPGDELYFLIGADAFSEIRTWKRWQDVIATVTFLVVSRPGHTYDIPAGARVERLDGVELRESSSEIRAALARGEAPPELPEAVLAYIREQRLYGAG